ncbi:hypothetical protein JCM24511_07316 [Saitozyma sp. JCM 24511]|nr:hypothetical protein JCM24511_07316 [Saitozyma sp. JCM 24511]
MLARLTTLKQTQDPLRRSLAGGYTPLYQAAYLLGGLQRGNFLRSGDEEKAFHDAVLLINAVPIELLRARLLGIPMGRDYRANWRFYDKKA